MKALKSKKLGNKGSILDLFYIPVVLFIAVIFLVVAVMVSTIINQTGLFSLYPNSQTAIDYSDSALISMDNMLAFMLIGLSLMTLLAGYFAYNHPAFFFVLFFLLCIAIFVTALLSNAFETFSTQENVEGYADRLPKIIFIMGNLPIYILLMGISLAIVMYLGYKKNTI